MKKTLLIASLFVGMVWTSSAQIFTLRDPTWVANCTKGSSQWTPASLGSELKIWLKTESLTGNNGNAVTYWADSSGNGYNATNAAATVYVTNTGSFGSHKSVFFAGGAATSQLYFSNALAICQNVGSASIVIAMQHSVTNQPQSVLLIGKNTFGSSRVYIRSWSAGTWSVTGRRLDADTAVDSDQAINQLTAHVRQGDADWANSDAYGWINNVSAISDTTWGTAGNTENTASSAVVLGGTGSGEYYKGWVAELIVTVPRMSAENRTNVYNYLKTKFAW